MRRDPKSSRSPRTPGDLSTAPPTASRWALALGILATAVFVAPPPAALAQTEVECSDAVEPRDVPEILRLRDAGAWDPPANLPDDILAAPILIPVTVHVVQLDNATGGLEPERIAQAFVDLNAAWKPVGMQFYKCGRTKFINSSHHYYINDWDERDELVAMEVVPNTVNLYFVEQMFVNLKMYCGVASYSWRDWQGIVVINNCAGQPTNPTTVPHEFGHYFDLFHTHESSANGAECADGSNGDTAGDLVADTPADPELDSENTDDCDYIGNEIDPCGDPYAPDTSNLMCYVPTKTCRTNFTPGQIARARATLFNLRPNLIGGGCASATATFTGTPKPVAGGPTSFGKPVVFARRACDASEGPCRTAGDGGTTDDFVTATIDVENSTLATLRLNLRIEADLSSLVPGGGLRDVTRYFRPLAGGPPIENPVAFAPGTTRFEMDIAKAIGGNLVGRFPANVPFIARLEAPGARGLVVDFSMGTLGFRPAAGVYDDCVVEEHLLARNGAQAVGDALVVRFDASDLPDAGAGWDVRGVQIVGGEIGGAPEGLAGLPLVELRFEDPSNPGQPDMSAAGLLRSAGPVTFGAAPATAYADFADLLYSPPVADPPALFVLAYVNPGDSMPGPATAIAASSGAGGAVLVGNSSALLGGATPLVPIPGRDLMIRLDLNGALSD